MKQNINLLAAIREKGLSQNEFALMVGDHFSLVSRVVRGWFNLDDARKAKYAEVLGKKQSELFED